MQLRRRKSEGAEVSTESLNDIMFFLLLFFLIISTMANPNVIKLSLPTAKAAKQMTKQPVQLSVKADKSTWIGSEEVPEGLLESRLTAIAANMLEPTIVLRIDRSLTIQDLVKVLSIGEKLKLRIVMASAPEK